MGSNFDYREYKTQTKDEVRKQFNAEAEEDRYMNGNSYSGGIGMLYGIDTWLEETFNTASEATTFICNKHTKYDDGAMAAQLTDGSWVIGGWCSS